LAAIKHRVTSTHCEQRLSRRYQSHQEAGRVPSWFPLLWNGGCFVPDTVVTLSDMPQGPKLQAALWSVDSFMENFADGRFESGGIALAC